MSRFLATFLFVGKIGPGTWASAVAMVLGMAILHYLGFYALAVGFVLVTVLGFWSCQAYLGDSGKDPADVVIDEVAGQWLTLLFPAAGFYFGPTAASLVASNAWLPWPAWVFPFALFRLFDIWKPWLVGRADRRHDPASC
jgi:phosphatidylglycerophosphatase A